MFGVPNHGMNITSLRSIVRDQVNRPLLELVGENSDVLDNMRRDFPVAFPFADCRLISLYETKTSPTAIKVIVVPNSQYGDSDKPTIGPKRLGNERASCHTRQHAVSNPQSTLR